MKTTIQKWGNSSGIRLPKPLLQELHLDNGTRGRWRSMVSNVYIPEEGDIVWLDYTPPSGHEQAGRMPGLVVSPKKYNKIGLALICPITSKHKGYSFEISLSSSVGFPSGVVLADQIRSLDWKARNASFKESAGSAVVDGVKDLLMLLIGK